ncbi:MAG: putative transposase [Porticoccaceae bacterium]|jgi:putative transposase
MSRPTRIEYPGAYYHVMNRGRGHQDIFHDDSYFEAFLSVVADAVQRFGLEVHSYCLMTNHYHLLVSTPEGNLQRVMRHIGGVYTQKYNRLKQTDGSLFKGRYKSILVDSDEYLLHVSKYIHLNPLEAKMVDELVDYKWSSYPAYIKKCKAQTWLSMSEVYDQLTDKRTRAKRYKAYVEEIELSNEIKSFYSKNRLSPVLGDKAFKDSLLLEESSEDVETPRYARLSGAPSIEAIVDVVAAYYKIDSAKVLELKRGRGLRNTPRKMAMHVAQHYGGYKLTEIACYFGMQHYGGVASAVSAVTHQMSIDSRLLKDVNSIVKKFDP